MNVSVFLEAAREIFTLYGIAWVGIGVLAGILLGAMPGISTNMAISLLFSLCYTIDGTAGVSMLLGIYCGGIYGGSISAILLNTPGTGKEGRAGTGAGDFYNVLWLWRFV